MRLQNVWFKNLSLANSWTRSLGEIPKSFNYACLRTYLVDSRDKTFDEDSLRAFKSLKAYKFYEDGYVQKIQSAMVKDESISTDMIFVSKSQVMASMEKKVYDVYVAIKADGNVIGGCCNCVAGLGEACSHVAALLFALEDFIAQGLNQVPSDKVCTERLQQWNIPAKRQVQHTTIDNIHIHRPEFGREKLPLHKKTTDPRHPEDREVDFERANVLHQKVSLAVPACGFARYGQLKTVNISPSGCEKVEGHKVLSSQDFLRQLTKSETEIHEIEQKTITQSDCALWYEERKIRLTASNFHSVAMRRTSSNPEVLAERLLVGLTKKTKAMKFGLEKEQSAAERYIEKMKKDGKNVTVKSCGFRISKSHPFLGASADRLASDEEGGLVLVEIKKSIIYMDL